MLIEFRKPHCQQPVSACGVDFTGPQQLLVSHFACEKSGNKYRIQGPRGCSLWRLLPRIAEGGRSILEAGAFLLIVIPRWLIKF